MNVVLLIGNVVKDAEVRSTPTGKSVANFRIATNEGRGDEKRTDYHSIVAWERLAEEARDFALTGTRVCIEGRLQTRNYESKKHEGEKVYVTEVVANSVRYLVTGASPEEELSEIKF
jgi:single-strand DNA-binding protein